MKYAYKNGILLDGTENMAPKPGLVILTDGETIERIVPESFDSSAYETVDLGGKYIMPGLINMHVHLPASGRPSQKPSDSKKLARLVKFISSNAPSRAFARKLCEGYAKTELLSGVTTLRTVGGILDIDSRVRDRAKAGKCLAPRILASNMAVSVPGGHMAYSLAYAATSAAEARAYISRIAEDSPDLIKLMITGGVLDAKVKGEPGELKMPPELIKAACDEAHARGLIVAAHVESPEGLRAALQNGVDSIEHGAMPDDEIIALFKERGAFLIATILPALPYALFDRSVSRASEVEQFNGNVVFEGMIGCAKACLAAGIPVGLGTDTGCPYSTHYGMWRELQNFHKYCGVSRSFALYTATLQNARLAGIGDVTGSVEAGKCADFIVCAENPLEDLTALRSLSMVVTRGRIIRKASVKVMPEVERELDKFV